MKKIKILITGANGQIGFPLAMGLKKKYGNDAVISTDISPQKLESHPIEYLDILKPDDIAQFIIDHEITQIYHLAAFLSAKAEQNPKLGWKINTEGLLNILEIAVKLKIDKVFYPSSIAVYGVDNEKFKTNQKEPLNPDSVYGISKVAGENWCHYYHRKFGLDVRSLRYPGVISHETMPGGGTTDYAVDIFHALLKTGNYTCFLADNTGLPMIYMSDAVKATLDLMEAPKKKITIRNSYNIQGMSFTPKEIFEEISKHLPKSRIIYRPDYRQKIADGWPVSLDDTVAQNDWHWKPNYNLESMVSDMLFNLKKNNENKVNFAIGSN